MTVTNTPQISVVQHQGVFSLAHSMAQCGLAGPPPRMGWGHGGKKDSDPCSHSESRGSEPFCDTNPFGSLVQPIDHSLSNVCK